MAEEYTYAVARIRALENSLFTDSVIDQLISCGDEEKCLRFLEEKGWGSTGAMKDAESVLACEEEKLWDVIRDLHIDMKIFGVLSLPKEFHNLKAAVKEAAAGPAGAAVYYDDADLSGKELSEIIQNRDFDRLPDDMKHAAEEALEALLHTGDGQACDVIIDRACLEAILESGREAGRAGYDVIREYAESTASIADVRVAVRGARTGKPYDFLIKALVDTESLSADHLARAASQGEEQVREYLMTTDYKDAVDQIAKGPSAFEKWCDDKITDSLQSEKYETFTIGPVVAYIIARQNEIKTVRLILTGKANGLSDESIRERVRRMYV